MEVQEREQQDRPNPQVVALKTPVPPPARPLFADALLEVGSTEKRRRGWAALASVVLQCLALGVVLLAPLLYTDVLPKQQLLTFLIAPPPPPPPPPAPAAAPATRVVRVVQSDLMDGRLRSPSRIPQKVQMIKEEEAPPPLSSSAGVVGGVPGGIPGGQLGGVIGGIISSTSQAAPVPKLAVTVPKRVRISQGVSVGLLIHKVEPAYPLLARQARIQGDVVLTAIISKDGTIENLQVVSGHPLLIQAALDAVKQWRYRPFLVSGEPVEVETRITVTFKFSQ
jgi:protein TonB